MKRLGVVLALVLLPSLAVACLWDYDTIKMERQRFPSTLELITGKFLRHSPEFYQWRITNRIKRLETDPKNIALLDDLAVAYDKTGQHDLAIQTAMRIEALQPNRYETASNLGTFEFHAGQLGKSLPHIDRALKINPDAHFGREKYQKWLTEYVLKRRNEKGNGELPLAKVEVPKDFDFDADACCETEFADSFSTFLDQASRTSKNTGMTSEDWRAALVGVQGMLRFANHESPILLEALGFLLMEPRHETVLNAKQLAARAFLKAGMHVDNAESQKSYRFMAHNVLIMQVPQDKPNRKITVKILETDFARELAEAKTWYDELRAKELTWIREGRDVDAEFDKLYTIEPEVAGMNTPDPWSPTQRFTFFAGSFCIGSVVFVVGSVLVIMRLTRKKR
jgi:tetratricopeptide (TPR) repeat protein